MKLRSKIHVSFNKNVMKSKLLFIPALLAIAGCSTNYLTRADHEFNQMRYSRSANLYEKHLSKNKNDLQAREKLAQSYLNMKNYKQAELEYMKIVTNPNSNPTAIYNYARTLMLAGKYQNAQDWMDVYMYRQKADKNAEYFYSNLKSIKDLQKDSGQIRLKPIEFKGQACAFSCAPYKKGIVYTAAVNSRNEKEVDPWTGTSFYNLYYSEPAADGWSKPVLLTGELNNQYHESTPLFSKKGDEIIFTRSNYTKKNKLGKNKENVSHLKLYSARLVQNEWKELKELPFNSEDYSTGHPAYFQNEEAVIFVSDRPGGKGGTDLYISYKKDGSFTEPVNLGPEINTAGNEAFPWYDEKDSTLYFSSEGHLNFGGLDVFKTRKTASGWKKPENLGFPVNSFTDDFSFVMNEDHKSGFLSSDRSGNDQIYQFKVEPIMIKLVGKTKVKDGNDLPLAEVFIEVVNKLTGVKRRFSSNLDGEFALTLEPEMEYKLFATKDNYYSSKPIDLSTKGITKTQQIIAEFELEKIEMEKPVVVNNMYYDLGKWNIKPDAQIVLDGLVKMMNDNPGISIELSSHTDSRASDKYNLSLSEKRAKAAVEYMISKGIDGNRLKAKGYGETMLLNKCSNGVKCSEEEHALNRRTEFRVIKVVKKEVNPFDGIE